ncbi:hypothetical protein VPH35_041348 [Triticum aestivum]
MKLKKKTEFYKEDHQGVYWQSREKKGGIASLLQVISSRSISPTQLLPFFSFLLFLYFSGGCWSFMSISRAIFGPLEGCVVKLIRCPLVTIFAMVPSTTRLLG